MAVPATSKSPSATANKPNKQHKPTNRPNPIQIFFGPTPTPASNHANSTSQPEHQVPRPVHYSHYYLNQHAQRYLYTPPPPSDIPSIEYLPTGAIILHRILPNNAPSTPTQLLFHIQNRTRSRTAKSVMTVNYNTLAGPSSLARKLTSFQFRCCHSNYVEGELHATVPSRPVIGHPIEFRVM